MDYDTFKLESGTEIRAKFRQIFESNGDTYLLIEVEDPVTSNWVDLEDYDAITRQDYYRIKVYLSAELKDINDYRNTVCQEYFTSKNEDW